MNLFSSDPMYFLIRQILKQRSLREANSGFTLLEILVVVLMVGILAAIAAPSWVTFNNRQQLGSAQSSALAAIRLAQSNAVSERRSWQACFRTSGNQLQVMTTYSTGCDTSSILWQPLISQGATNVSINTSASNTLPQISSGIYYVRFKYNGLLHDDWVASVTLPSKISFKIRNSAAGSDQRCVLVATLLGAVRTESNTTCN